MRSVDARVHAAGSKRVAARKMLAVRARGQHSTKCEQRGAARYTRARV